MDDSPLTEREFVGLSDFHLAVVARSGEIKRSSPGLNPHYACDDLLDTIYEIRSDYGLRDTEALVNNLISLAAAAALWWVSLNDDR